MPSAIPTIAPTLRVVLQVGGSPEVEWRYIQGYHYKVYHALPRQFWGGGTTLKSALQHRECDDYACYIGLVIQLSIMQQANAGSTKARSALTKAPP